MSTVQVRALRAFRACGDTFAAGAVAELSPGDAALVLESGRGELVDPQADLLAVRDAVHAANRLALKKAGGMGRVAQSDGPWRTL